jgi:hypothetical protein
MAVAVYTSLTMTPLFYRPATDCLLVRVVVLVDDVSRSFAVEAEETHNVLLGKLGI